MTTGRPRKNFLSECFSRTYLNTNLGSSGHFGQFLAFWAILGFFGQFWANLGNLGNSGQILKESCFFFGTPCMVDIDNVSLSLCPNVLMPGEFGAPTSRPGRKPFTLLMMRSWGMFSSVQFLGRHGNNLSHSKSYFNIGSSNFGSSPVIFREAFLEKKR